MSTVAKGNYHRKKTQEWLESEGYIVAPLEVTRRIFVPGKDGKPDRVVFSKKDLWGADLIARNGTELIFIQVKANPGHIAEGMKELSRGIWPPWVQRWVVHWPPRTRTQDGPRVEVVQ